MLQGGGKGTARGLAGVAGISRESRSGRGGGRLGRLICGGLAGSGGECDDPQRALKAQKNASNRGAIRCAAGRGGRRAGEISHAGCVDIAHGRRRVEEKDPQIDADLHRLGPEEPACVRSGGLSR
ncbi:MAG: hypothetical protein AMXMBFR47_05710 [Planctomycetota bacterium]